MYTGDKEFIEMVYDASYKYLNLWDIGDNNLVIHRGGSWDWMDWGENADTTALENSWYYYALSSLKNMAELIGKDTSKLTQRLDTIKQGYYALWTDKGYKSNDVKNPDDRANAIAVLSRLADESKYDTLENLFKRTMNSSPYMEYYVLEALCQMNRYNTATDRIKSRYKEMINADYSTLWEGWSRKDGTMNHAWSGGPLVIMSKYIAGIKPTKAGYDEFIIKPQYDSFTEIHCTVPSVKGLITLDYNSSNLSIELPENANATLYVPANCSPLSDDAVFVMSDGNYDVYKVNTNAVTTVKFDIN